MKNLMWSEAWTPNHKVQGYPENTELGCIKYTEESMAFAALLASCSEHGSHISTMEFLLGALQIVSGFLCLLSQMFACLFSTKRGFESCNREYHSQGSVVLFFHIMSYIYKYPCPSPNASSLLSCLNVNLPMHDREWRVTPGSPKLYGYGCFSVKTNMLLTLKCFRKIIELKLAGKVRQL